MNSPLFCGGQYLTCMRLLVGAIALASPNPAAAQVMYCGAAVQQLQQYVAQVNAMANTEYLQIPMKCGGNPYCGNMLFQQLNVWYAQQSGLVNRWYSQIVSQCNGSPIQGPGVVVNSQSGQPPSMNGQNVEELTVDDSDKPVRIRIPSNPKGFR